MSSVTVGIPDPATCAIDPDAGGGGGGGTAFVGSPPITTAEIQNPFAADGVLLTNMLFPNLDDADVLFSAGQTDADFPFIEHFVDPSNGTYFSDGSFNPTDGPGIGNAYGYFVNFGTGRFVFFAPSGTEFDGGGALGGGVAGYFQSGSVVVSSPGYGLSVSEEDNTNSKQGIVNLTAGTVTVLNTSVTANSRIFLTGQDVNAVGPFHIENVVPGESFDVVSALPTDSGSVAFEIFEPA